MAKAIDLNSSNSSSKKYYPSIYRTIRWSFGIVTLTMFGLFWGVIYMAENQLEVISLHHWLDTEASTYTTNYIKYGEDTPLPNQSEFTSYWSKQALPDWLKQYNQPGFYEHLLGEEDKHFIVIQHPSGEGLMYLLFEDDADDYLDAYEDNLHNSIFMMGTIVSLLIFAYGVYMVRSISKPLLQIEQKISMMSPDKQDFTVDTRFSESRKIEQALLDSKQDIAGYFQREKEFSRFASHELRTPIMVIQGSSELLEKVPDMPNVANKAVKRIQVAGEEMKVLTETFLLLGKESIDANYFDHQNLETVLEQQVVQLEPLFAKQGASYQIKILESATINAPESFITVVINNLIKNAFSYSIGDINIELDGTQLQITNRHEGQDTYNAGYGCGLAIVERICQRMEWNFDTLDDGIQFVARVDFQSISDKSLSEKST
ncbi:histidine kinase dimerization/phospho-acceptor domain-containing protein [Vibrio paucivorans]